MRNWPPRPAIWEDFEHDNDGPRYYFVWLGGAYMVFTEPRLMLESEL